MAGGGVTYDKAEARRVAERLFRKATAAKNRPTDLINIALENVVKAGTELPAFLTLDDETASAIRKEVNAAICAGTHGRRTRSVEPGC